MLIVLPVHSQDAIKKDSVTVAFDTAYKMNVDLNDYDRLIANKTEANLGKCLELSREKDSLAAVQYLQVNTAEKRLKNKDEKIEFLEYKLEHTAEKESNGLMWFGSGIGVGLLLTLLFGK